MVPGAPPRWLPLPFGVAVVAAGDRLNGRRARLVSRPDPEPQQQSICGHGFPPSSASLSWTFHPLLARRASRAVQGPDFGRSNRWWKPTGLSGRWPHGERLVSSTHLSLRIVSHSLGAPARPVSDWESRLGSGPAPARMSSLSPNRFAMQYYTCLSMKLSGSRDATYEPSRFPVAVPYPSPHRATPAYVVVTSSDLDTSRNKASVSGLSWISRILYMAQLVNRMRHLVTAAARQARSLAPGARPTRWNQLR